MIIFLNQNPHRNFLALIAVATAIGSWGLRVQGSDDEAVSVIQSSDLKSTDATLASQTTPVDNEANADETVKIAGKLNQYPCYVNISQYPGELCNRVCVSGQQRICHFEFTLELYQAMGVACGKCEEGVEADCNNPQCVVGDGVEKGVMSINRQVPGPAIHVCENDIVVVDVHSRAQGSAATIHWHGLSMVDTPYMDGVPFVTQCPILYGNSFRYKYRATDPGTQFYHSHSGHHKINGQYGALIVRRPMEPLSSFYDYDLPEHHILISDWMHDYGEDHFPGRPRSPITINAVLLNGRGVYTNPKTGERTKIRPTIFYVRPFKRYRFRIINSVSHICPFQMQIEKHSMSVIASDSHDVVPYPCDTLVSNAGERYDFILNANQTTGDFWIRVRGLGVCSTSPIESYALIRYRPINDPNNLQIPPFPSYKDEYPAGTILNHPNAACWGAENDHCVTELTALDTDGELHYGTPDYKFFLSFKNIPVPNAEIFKPGEYNHFSNIISNLTVVGAINNNSLVYPDYPPLTQPESIQETQFCDSLSRPQICAGRRVCPCTHRLKIRLNSIVQLIIVDENLSAGLLHHPFHLHGHHFMVIDLGQHPYGLPMTVPLAMEMEKSKILPRDTNFSPPFKDTVSIPSSGYAVVRFRANNPGFWMLHCHYEWHLSIGMALLVQVGDTSEMVQAPKGFPKCGNYLPPLRSHFF